jgi:hypothetical protein
MFEPQITELPPGPELAAALSRCELVDLDADQALTWLAGWQRMAGWVDSQTLRGVAHFADLRCGEDLRDGRSGRERKVQYGGVGTPEVPEFSADDIAAELGMSRMRASGLVADALDLRRRLPGVLRELAAGAGEGWRARLVARGTRELNAQQVAGVEAEVLPVLAHVTPAMLEKLVAAAAIAADPQAADERTETARSARYVAVDSAVDGVSDVWARLDTSAAIRLDARIDQVADLLRELGSSTPKAELRAVALGLLADPEAVQHLWQRVCAQRAGRPLSPAESKPMPATTLYVHHRLDDGGTPRWDLEDVGPISARAARELIGHAYVTVKPVIDLRQEVTSVGYQPSAHVREATLLTSPRCPFPFCNGNGRNGDFDHVDAYPRGPTSSSNGALPCRHHHRIRTHGRWVVKQPFPGVFVWRSPTGRLYLTDGRGHTQRLGHPPAA